MCTNDKRKAYLIEAISNARTKTELANLYKEFYALQSKLDNANIIKR